MEMLANPSDVTIYAAIMIGSLAVYAGLLAGFSNWMVSNIGSGAASTGVSSTAATIVSTGLVAVGAAGAAVGGHIVATDIVGVDPPPIIEDYLAGTALDNQDCTWTDSILGTWYIDDISMTIDADSGDRQDLPTIVGGTMKFQEGGKILFVFDRKQEFEIESDNLNMQGSWECLEEDKIRLFVDLDLEVLEEQFDIDIEELYAEARESLGVDFDLPQTFPGGLGFILVYSVHDHGEFMEHDVMELNLKTAGLNGLAVTFFEAISASGIFDDISQEELTLEKDCVLTEVACWDKIVAKSAAYFAREIELSRES